MEASPSENGDLLTLARSRVRAGPIPDWASATSYKSDFTAKVKRPLTPLLLERQAHVELHEHYFHQAVRLETMPAVQHHSQWRVEFSPKTEWVVLHSVKTRRGALEKEHLSLEKIQFLRRESGLERFIVDGGITLLLLLEDVAVGDVMEFSYTIKSQPRLLPQYWSTIFDLPPAAEIGKHYFAVRHAATRQMRWKSSSQNLAPISTVRKSRTVGQVEVSHSNHQCEPLTADLSPSDGLSENEIQNGPAVFAISSVTAASPHAHVGPKEALSYTQFAEARAQVPSAIKEAVEEVELVWQGENVVTLEPEEGTPVSEILYPWIQFSDCPDWQAVARGVVEAWPQDVQGDGLKKLLEEIKNASPELVGQVSQAIKLIQDGFRYLSVNVELGGCIPADPEIVIRRRYGDCKDLALLLSRLLLGLGVSTRPVLVHTNLRKMISQMLPSPMFNHVIVEFQIGEERRWIDATAKFQGGNALNRFVPNFGFGLPVDATATELASVPQASLPGGTYEIKDSFLLDTSGHPSYLGVQITAKGIYAEHLRAEFENTGSTAVAKNRLQMCANRFYRAARTGEMQWRDDRERNEFCIAEVFEIDGFLRREANRCLFEIRSEAAAALRVPPQLTRRDPLQLPYPCHETHIVEIDFQGLNYVKIHPYESDSKFFILTRQVKSLQKYLKATFTVRMLTDVVPAKDGGEYRRQVEMAWRACGFVLQLPLGFARMRKRESFGTLPETTPGISTSARAESKRTQGTTPATVYVPDHLTTATKTEPVPPTATAKPRSEKHSFIDPKTATTTGRREGKSRYSRSGDNSSGRYNLKCVVSLGLAIAAVWLLIFGILTAGSHLRGLAGTLGLLTLPTVAAAVVLAILGLRELAKSSRKSSGRGMAIAALWISCLLGLILVPMFSAAFKAAMRARDRAAYGQLLKFPAEQFVFHTPGPPWVQVNARPFGPHVTAAFAQPGPITSIVMVTNLGVAFPELQGRLIDWCKDGEQRSTKPWRIVSEGNIERNGVSGWQFETTGNFQGHEVYSITWIVTKNGFGYVMRTSSRSELMARTKEAADYIFSRFEPMTPQQSAQ